MTYVLANLLLHSYDALIAGLAYYLTCFTRHQLYDIALALLYCLALVVLALLHTPFDWWGPIAAAIGLPLAHIRGLWHQARTKRRNVNGLR